MSSIEDVVRRAIRASGKALLTIQQDTGVERSSLSRFLCRQTHLRSDALDKLAAYFGLELKPATRRARRKTARPLKGA